MPLIRLISYSPVPYLLNAEKSRISDECVNIRSHSDDQISNKK